jgi:hypothetical protein
MAGFDNNWRCQHDNTKGCPQGGCDHACARDEDAEIGRLTGQPIRPTTPPASTCIEHAYGTTTRLSFQIKVF